jgi:hypothetical protein
MLLQQGNKPDDPRKSLFELAVCKESCLCGMPVYIESAMKLGLGSVHCCVPCASACREDCCVVRLL